MNAMVVSKQCSLLVKFMTVMGLLVCSNLPIKPHHRLDTSIPDVLNKFMHN